jgi:hypothetical protein
MALNNNSFASAIEGPPQPNKNNLSVLNESEYLDFNSVNHNSIMIILNNGSAAS